MDHQRFVGISDNDSMRMAAFSRALSPGFAGPSPVNGGGILWWGVAAILVLCFGVGVSRAGEKIVELDEVLSIVEQKNPAVRSSRDAARAAEFKASVAWPFPVVRYEREKPMAGDTITRISGEQEIPFPGKLTLEGSAMKNDAGAMSASSDVQALAVRSRARELYYRMWRLGESLRRVDEQRALVARITFVMVDRTSAGQGGMSGASDPGDVMVMRAESGRLNNERLLLEQELSEARFELNALADRPLDAEWGTPRAPRLAVPADSLQALTEKTISQGPSVVAARLAVQSAVATDRRARLAFAPDFGVMVERMRDEAGMKGSQVGVSATVPLWASRPRAEQKEARAALSSANNNARAAEREAERSLAVAYGEVLVQGQRARRFESDILPALKTALALTQRRYEGRSVDVARFLGSARELLQAEMEWLESLEQYAVRWGVIEEWVGSPIKGVVL